MAGATFKDFSIRAAFFLNSALCAMYLWSIAGGGHGACEKRRRCLSDLPKKCQKEEITHPARRGRKEREQQKNHPHPKFSTCEGATRFTRFKIYTLTFEPFEMLKSTVLDRVQMNAGRNLPNFSTKIRTE